MNDGFLVRVLYACAGLLAQRYEALAQYLAGRHRPDWIRIAT
jgi:hypothetical protein